GQGRADAEGKFRLTVPRISEERFWNASVLARAPGFGVGEQSFRPGNKEPKVRVTLAAERTVAGRLFDLQGVPAAGVKVRVTRLHGYGRGGGQVAGLDEAPDGLAAWPRPAVSDAEGRFALRGLPADHSYTLVVESERFARQTLVVSPGPWERQMLESSA